MTPIENDGRRCTADEADAAFAAIGVFPVLDAHMTIPEIAECLRKHSLVAVFQAVLENQECATLMQSVERVTAAMQREGLDLRIRLLLATKAADPDLAKDVRQMVDDLAEDTRRDLK